MHEKKKTPLREREPFGSSYWILFTIAHRCLNIGPVVPEINRPPTLPSLYRERDASVGPSLV